MHTKEFPMHTKKLRVLTKSLGKHANFFRMNGKGFMKDADVFSKKDSAAPMLGETRFMHTFFHRNMHEEKSKDVFSFGIMHEEKSKDAFSVRKVHPPAILQTFSAFVPKQRAFVRNPAGSVDNDDTVQRTAVAGREAGMARHPETCDACILRRGRLTG